MLTCLGPFLADGNVLDEDFTAIIGGPEITTNDTDSRRLSSTIGT